jgi:hypothetical protein
MYIELIKGLDGMKDDFQKRLDSMEKSLTDRVDNVKKSVENVEKFYKNPLYKSLNEPIAQAEAGKPGAVAVPIEILKKEGKVKYSQ